MKKLAIILCLQINIAYCLEVSCDFEEVYGNGEVQQGQFLYKNKKLRYEYFDKN